MAESKRYEVLVEPVARFLADQSDPAKNQFVFTYTITITNTGDIAAQLLGRHWIITDGDHKVQEVKGLGVVGQQPLLQPGESFEYTSGASIATSVGTMQGVGSAGSIGPILVNQSPARSLQHAITSESGNPAHP